MKFCELYNVPGKQAEKFVQAFVAGYAAVKDSKSIKKMHM
jgi:hypothetical protein